jgi:hypothetical protein
VTASAAAATGGTAITIDGSGSRSGGSPARELRIELLDPTGNPVSFESNGQAQTSMTIATPFAPTTVLVRKPVPGTYTVRTSAQAEKADAPSSTCQATVLIDRDVIEDNMDWFAQGAFGKQRRNYEYEVPGLATSPIAGFCDPMLGLSAGPLFWFNDGRMSFAPVAGLAFMFGDFNDDQDYGDQGYNNVSAFLEAVVNFHLTPRGAFIGTGLGWWDVFDGDHNTGNWIVNFGVPVGADGKWQFVGEGRLFFDSPDGIDNNYQVWGGMRYIFR